jgi:hypothetical protein
VSFAYGMDGANLCVCKDANCDVQKKEIILKIEMILTSFGNGADMS